MSRSSGTIRLFAALAIGLAPVACTPGETPSDAPATPWKTAVDQEGRLTVMGVTLGDTTAAGAMGRFNAEPEIHLFLDAAGAPSLEAYFGKVSPGGVAGTLIANLRVAPRWGEAARERSVKTEQAANGDRKITLAPVDYRTSLAAPIVALTFIPSVQLDDEIVRKRFGAPEKVLSAAGGVSYWLYPATGTVVAIDPQGKESVQYVMPARFDELAPLATGGAFPEGTSFRLSPSGGVSDRRRP
jgi:hypothetical protein